MKPPPSAHARYGRALRGGNVARSRAPHEAFDWSEIAHDDDGGGDESGTRGTGAVPAGALPFDTRRLPTRHALNRLALRGQLRATPNVTCVFEEMYRFFIWDLGRSICEDAVTFVRYAAAEASRGVSFYNHVIVCDALRNKEALFLRADFPPPH